MKINSLKKQFSSAWFNSKIFFSDILKLRRKIEQEEIKKEINNSPYQIQLKKT